MRNVIGTVLETGDPVPINLQSLVESRLLIQATSGGGKSYLLRRLLEQTHGQVQQIVIDVEGEFSTLRAKFDYVLAAKGGGDTLAEPRAAKLLAHRLLELKASAIVDISELGHQERVSFVRIFVGDGLLEAPKAYRHPALIVIDEAQTFCPQDGRAESTNAVLDLCTKGRKRGLSAILATQRISQLNKTAVAQCLNRFFGRTSLDIDMKRAGDELGFDKERRLELRRLHPGQFFVFGPSLPIALDGALIKVGDVITEHPKAGGRIRFKAPPPTDHIKALLPKLSDLPAEAEAREATAKTMQRDLQAARSKATDLMLQVRQLEATIATLEKRPTQQTTLMSTKQTAAIERSSVRLANAIELLNKLTAGLSQAVDPLRAASLALALERREAPQHAEQRRTLDRNRLRQASELEAAVRRGAGNGNAPIHPAEVSRNNAAYRLLAVLKVHPEIPDARLGALAGISAKKSTFRVGMAKLRNSGLITASGAGWTPTAAGLELVRDVQAPPSGAAAADHWRRKLGRGVLATMFDAMIDAGHDGIGLDALANTIDTNRGISTFRVALNKLKQNGLVTVRNDYAFVNEGLL